MRQQRCTLRAFPDCLIVQSVGTICSWVLLYSLKTPFHLQNSVLLKQKHFCFVVERFILRAIIRSIIHKIQKKCTSIFMVHFIQFSAICFDRYCCHLQGDIIIIIRIQVRLYSCVVYRLELVVGEVWTVWYPGWN